MFQNIFAWKTLCLKPTNFILEQADLFKDPAMLKRFQDIATLPEKEKECLLTTVDHFIKASKISLK